MKNITSVVMIPYLLLVLFYDKLQRKICSQTQVSMSLELRKEEKVYFMCVCLLQFKGKKYDPISILPQISPLYMNAV